MSFSKCKETSKKDFCHVVILGAGASCATILHGDKNGKKIPAMGNFIEVAGLSDCLSNIKLKTTSENFEEIFMELEERSVNEVACLQAKKILEQKTYSFIKNFELPDIPTIYDFLLLSLTKKDLIATFNWDPLLVQSLQRVSKITKDLPYVVFLHGNVAVGYCETDNFFGNVYAKCPYCNGLLAPIKLLYPVKNKDYDTDVFIRKSWTDLRKALSHAYMLTIFGYSAPKSDEAAISMLKAAWNCNSSNEIAEIEIVDIKGKEELENSWADFIDGDHFSCYTSFFDTLLAQFPRHSCEALFEETMNCNFLNHSKGFKENMSFDDINTLLHNIPGFK